MKSQIPTTVPLGELILTVFDEAAQHSDDPQEVSHLAAQAVEHMLGRASKSTSSPLLLSTS